MGQMAARLDNFTDAAFAFAVTLLVIGGSAPPTSYRALANAVAEVPTFAIGFAIIAMFWFAHLRWRHCRGAGDWLSSLLSVLLVFLVLIYVQPLRAMARSLSHYIGSDVAPFHGDVGDLFVIYGAGFVAMAVVTAALFAEALRAPPADPEQRAAIWGEMIVWIILAATGLVSIVLAAFETTETLAPWVYATLPLTTGLFTARYDWSGGKAKEPADS
jgi:uncharacterized membrane protein